MALEGHTLLIKKLTTSYIQLSLVTCHLLLVTCHLYGRASESPLPKD